MTIAEKRFRQALWWMGERKAALLFNYQIPAVVVPDDRFGLPPVGRAEACETFRRYHEWATDGGLLHEGLGFRLCRAEARVEFSIQWEDSLSWRISARRDLDRVRGRVSSPDEPVEQGLIEDLWEFVGGRP